MEKYNFQYCQKIVVYSSDESEILLCKRKDEDDFDGTFSFIGGKMETTDRGIVEGLQREKDEEVGRDFKIRIFPTFSTNVYYVKNDGSAMILPHYYAIYERGDIKLSGEYSEYQWVPVSEIDTFESKIDNIPQVLSDLALLRDTIYKTESVIV